MASRKQTVKKERCPCCDNLAGLFKMGKRFNRTVCGDCITCVMREEYPCREPHAMDATSAS